jgi:hypothetical protein
MSTHTVQAVRVATPTLLVAAVLALAVSAATGSPAAAQGRTTVFPMGGMWCGATPEGYPVNFEVSGDSRFVLWARAAVPNGSVSTREVDVKGPTDAQVADSKFMFRQRRDQTQCERDQRRDPRQTCNLVTVEDVSFRGTFRDSVTATGSFMGQYFYNPGVNDRGRASRRLVNGTFTAWPASFAPCP